MVTLANSVIGRSVRTASAALLEAGTQTKAASLQGTEALFFHRLDAAEHARRQDVAAGRLDRMAALETLLTLPVGIPVPLASLEPANGGPYEPCPRAPRTVTARR
ncbi:hypothetical protein [Streptomyces sp. NPDC055287]